MSAQWKWYGNGLKAIARGAVQLETDTLYVMLCTSGYSPDQDADDFRNDVVAEAAGAGYTADGKQLGALSFSYDGPSKTVRVVVPDISWPGSTITARVAVMYKHRGGSAAADELIAYAVNDVDKSSVSDTFLVDNPSPTLRLIAGV